MSQKEMGALGPHYQLALLRFAIVSGLLRSPPKRGELQHRIRELAVQTHRDPVTGDFRSFGFSTIERWYYLVRQAEDPIEVLRRSVRSDAGIRHVHPELVAELKLQYRRYQSWTFKLHADNIEALVRFEKREWKPWPSYSTVRRIMREHCWLPVKQQDRRLQSKREIRSYEASHVHGLWHLDFHEGGRCRIADAEGNWFKPWLFAVIDDRSRVICHAQWFHNECAQTLAHGLHQAFHRRGLPRSIMSDRGGAELAAETLNGLIDCSIDHKPTLAESPYQNGKQERFWDTLEERLVSMLKGVPLDLDFLNRVTLAWVEHEYHQTRHTEIGCTPLQALIRGPNASRPAPDSAKLRFRFTVRTTRLQRRTDGTVSIKHIRFELPRRLASLRKVHLRYRRWDLSEAWVIDPVTDDTLARIVPLDKAANADGRRRAVDVPDHHEPIEPEGLPPLLRHIMREFAATGLPAPYIPLQQETKHE